MPCISMSFLGRPWLPTLGQRGGPRLLDAPSNRHSQRPSEIPGGTELRERCEFPFEVEDQTSRTASKA